MTDITAPLEEPARKPLLKRMLPILAPVLALAAGLGTTYAGLWSPMALLGKGDAPAGPVAVAPTVTFVDVPRLVVSLPGGGNHTVALSVLLDVDPAQAGAARTLVPRLSDAFNTFLADIDPAAFERRGILEIVRLELATRARFILGDKAVNDLLITEFRIQ